MRRISILNCCGLLLLGGCVSPGERSEPTTTTARAATPADTEPDHLALAAAHLDRGEESAALPHLMAHVQARPNAVMIRAYLAELMLKLGKLDESWLHFERYTRDAHGMPGQPQKHLVHCHTRLMEIAQQRNDAYAEALHRGIGLTLMVRQWEAEPVGEDRTLGEQTLTNAAAALREATRLRPTEPKGYLYLSEVLGRLGQPSAARATAKRGVALLPDATLTDDDVARLLHTVQ
jgi:predicted Zn-dependent protease